MTWAFYISVIAVVGAFDPSSDSSAVIEGGLTSTPWAKRKTSLTVTAEFKYVCTSSFKGVLTIYNDNLWSSAYYYMLQNKSILIIAQKGTGPSWSYSHGDFYFICDTEPVAKEPNYKLNDNEQILKTAEYDVYSKCNTNGTYMPTTSPTAAPSKVPTTQSPTFLPSSSPTNQPAITSAPTSAPTSTPTMYYGPMSEAECYSNGGWQWFESKYGPSEHTLARYCCNLCTEYLLYEWEFSGCACPAYGNELTVRNNAVVCTWPTNASGYPDPDPPHPDNITSCIGTTPSPTPHPTFMPTKQITTRAQCWEYDDEGCYNSGMWCDTIDYYQASNYTINALIQPYSSTKKASRYDVSNIINGSENLDFAIEQIIKANYINTTCWCSDIPVDWLPFGMIPVLTTTNTISHPIPNFTVPTPHLFPRTFHMNQIANGLYLHTTRPIGMFGAIVNGYGVGISGIDRSLSYLAPTYDECKSYDGCTPLDTTPTITFTEFTYTACRYVCLDIYYAPHHTPIAPLRVTLLNNISIEQRCPGSWVNARLLDAILMRTQWQIYADVLNLTSTRISRPSFDIDVVKNCNLPGLKFCSLNGSGISNVSQYCAMNGEDVFNGLASINYSGFYGLTCTENASYTLNKVYPRIQFGSGEVDDDDLTFESWGIHMKTYLEDLAWRAMLIPFDSCNGQKEFIIDFDNISVSVNVDLVAIDLTKDTGGCTGYSGCKDFDADICTSVSGCDYNEFVTSTSTTSTFTFGPFDPVTFSPTAKNASVEAPVSTTNKDSALIAAGVFASLVLILSVFYIFMPTTTEGATDDDEEEANPLII